MLAKTEVYASIQKREISPQECFPWVFIQHYYQKKNIQKLIGILSKAPACQLQLTGIIPAQKIVPAQAYWLMELQTRTVEDTQIQIGSCSSLVQFISFMRALNNFCWKHQPERR